MAVDKMILSINVFDDDDRVSGHIEVVQPDSKYGPVRVREFDHNDPHNKYTTWHFDGRVDAVSFAMTLAGFGPLADNSDRPVYDAWGALLNA